MCLPPSSLLTKLKSRGVCLHFQIEVSDYYNTQILAPEPKESHILCEAIFLPLEVCNPSPSSFFGFVTLCHPTQCIFFIVSVDPQRKFLLTRSKPCMIRLGRWEHCITKDGMAEDEAWINTALPTNDNKLAFQLTNFYFTLSKIKLKS